VTCNRGHDCSELSCRKASMRALSWSRVAAASAALRIGGGVRCGSIRVVCRCGLRLLDFEVLGGHDDSDLLDDAMTEQFSRHP